jgi:carboxyl-terminal processing protease
VYKAITWTLAVLLGVLLLALVFVLGQVTSDGGGESSSANSGEPGSADSEGEVDFGTLDEIVDILERDYFGRDNIDQEALYQAAVQGLVESLADTGTFYIDPSSYQTSVGPSGSFDGIGATVWEDEDNNIVIVATIKGSPAEAAGLQSGDVITAVDGESTEGWAVDKAVLRIRGESGTEVVLTIRHPSGESEDITLVRDEIKIESVLTTPPSGALRNADGNPVSDLAYVRIREFTSRTPADLEAVVRDAEDTNKNGLIIDLRGNPGGLLDETVQSADLFLDDGTILIEVDSEDQERRYEARPGGAALEIPIVILMDQFSASGSEVLAAALRDNDRATIVGETSFGKGTVNVSRELPDGGALFVTIARWLTPEGVLIDGAGIRPDIEVVRPEGDFDPNNDVQLFRAIEHLQTLQAAEQGAPATSRP